MSTADKLICSLQIGTNQLVTEVRQFDGAVLDPSARAEAAELLADTVVALVQIGERLDPGSQDKTIHLPAVWNVA